MSRLQTSSRVLRKSSFICLVWIISLTAASAQSPTIMQSTTGSCSPVVGQAGGNVTITCQGLNEQTLALLNDFLDKKFATLLNAPSDKKTIERLHQFLDKNESELQAKTQEAEEWAQKYKELAQRLGTEEQDNPLAQQAKALLKEGKLDEAGELLDELIDSGAKELERLKAQEERVKTQQAERHFNRAEVYSLQFQPDHALPHYEQAYRYRPDNVKYVFQYAFTLQKQNRYTQAQAVYQEALGTYRKLAEANPQAYLPDVATTLNNLAVLYSDTQRLSDSEQAYQEALGIRRKLAEANPQAYLPYVANTLNNLAVLELDQADIKQAQVLVSEALTIRRDLYQKHAMAYGNDLAQSLAVEVMVLMRTEKEASIACGRLQEMSNVAVSEGLKQWAKERAKGLCDKAADDTTIGKQ